MPLHFNHPQKLTTFYRNPISGHDLNVPELAETFDRIEMDTGAMTFQNWCFEGFRLANNILGQQRATTYGIQNDIDAVKIYFNRRGRMHIDYRQLSKSFSVGGGQYNMLYSAELDSRMSHIDNHSEMFSLQITRECFQDLIDEGRIALGPFAGKTSGGQAALFSNQWLPMNAAMERCIDEIVHCHYARDLKKIYLRSKAVELFVLFADAATGKAAVANDRHGKPTVNGSFIKRSMDRDKLYFAKDYLARNYANPPTLPGLAKIAGLNEFKLKSGFKELFDTSVIDFLINYRLERAREMLLCSTKPVTEIAYETGYTSPAYFSKAFRKKYGISPSKL